MNSPEALFRKLQSFKHPAGFKTPQEMLLDHCNEVLGTVERIHFDYKQKNDRRIPKLEDTDKRNFAKAVSGFANSGGGVLIWGIEDETLAPKPITGVQVFVASLLELAAQVTDPSVQNVDADWIPSNTDETGGFGFVLIPQSVLPPHRVVLRQEKIQNHYYIRSGSSFVVASHTQLEDMFGRRPKPNLVLNSRVSLYSTSGDHYHLHVILGIENRGRGVAKAPMLMIYVHPPYTINRYGLDGNGHFGLKPLSTSPSTKEKRYGASADTVVHSGVIHEVVAVDVKVPKRESWPNIPELQIDYQMAAENIQIVQEQKIFSGKQIWEELQRQINGR